MTEQTPLFSLASNESLASNYARYLLQKGLSPRIPAGERHRSFSIPAPEDVNEALSTSADVGGRVCIVGGGVAGLMVAMCLQAVGIYDFDILEASDRVGGRVYTYTLDETGDPHNYYDIGAMRIPDIQSMASTMNMIREVLKIESVLTSYVYHHKNGDEANMYLYKNMTSDQMGDATKPFDDAVKDIIADFKEDFDLAFNKYIMGNDPKFPYKFDEYSTRSWLQTAFPEINKTKIWKYDEIETAETFETSTGLFDQAFSETIIDYYDFAATDPPGGPAAEWYRLEGGMEKFTDAMYASVQGKGVPSISGPGVDVQTNQAVTAMKDNGTSISLTVLDTVSKSLSTKEYAAVFNTTALPCLERMDIGDLNLDAPTLTGIRTLSYDRATKVVIKFTKPWWLPLMSDQIGGISSSDFPISNVVYPSWNDGPDKPAVLMVSYSWAQDATRMGSIIPGGNYTTATPSKTDPIVAICLQNLARLWAKTPNAPSYQQLSDMYVTHHAYAWSHDPYTGGAFALFGPGQFRNAYPAFFETKCGGKFSICGEATSAHHAWISGALDSAYTSVMSWLCYWGKVTQMAALKASNLGGGTGQHPAELDETLLHWAAGFSPGGKYDSGVADGKNGLKDANDEQTNGNMKLNVQ